MSRVVDDSTALFFEHWQIGKITGTDKTSFLTD